MAYKLPRPKHIAFIDETGDHGLDNIDPKMPVFATCAFTTTVEKYATNAAANLKRLKYSIWGHECVVLHGHKIRKRSPPFNVLRDTDVHDHFMKSMTWAFDRLDGTLIGAAIDKPRLKEQYKEPESPFFLSLQFVLERLHMNWSGSIGPDNKLLCVFEARGGGEDERTEEWFDEICAGKNYRGEVFHFTKDFQTKERNICGHQYADLAAYSIAKYVETKNENRKDWQVIRKKLRQSWLGKIEGYGLKVFP